jgi:D-alanyl-D-alanine carboxypeptidase (penicillin-binding protein 5/6)
MQKTIDHVWQKPLRALFTVVFSVSVSWPALAQGTLPSLPSLPTLNAAAPAINPAVEKREPAAIPAPPALSAKSYILVDPASGKILMEHNADERLPPASLTKLMTSYILSYEVMAGRVKNEDMVTISKNAWSQNPVFAAKFNGSSLMFIEPPTPVSILDLHRGIVISSGNDATVAVAEHLAGTESAFADMMNQHAKRLGMTNSNFVNSHGLDVPDHYTTARDLAILSRAIISTPDYYLHREKEFTYNNITQQNRNGLLNKDSSVDGLKTGYTEGAGYCLVASAKRGDMRLIAVVMGTASVRTREDEAQAMLNYGFRYYETYPIYKANAEITNSPIWGGTSKVLSLGIAQDLTLTIPRGRRDDMKAVVNIPPNPWAPVAVNQALGEIVISMGDEVIHKEPLIALADVPESGFFARVWDHIRLFFSGLFGG